ncbi:2-C-methyl-D-erythritol 2,4-cyclodiphosphate synthase [Hyphomicrobium nitrativorans NL23]|uniref:Bifunctional enzyme IspD/IspF n=1 Tax=Hyphomicrobium nitrativorans NL23 TaxID=1029756 RepID=V5SFU1_9HYPH|nr:bifunctional 2-C-methyl-D-erythritol 4-phosphate cytidylyltransferase/2-C-methyl-D-erythritol 2,4-cyclodiphosphate synthase [Hyphomicrobium nitrativorans]AHB48804.1 2-C-methyl-D-erythritol 2,4-cyclodiphosphate synthase [Hyphomicrobium nitrativorans NL23]
MPLVTAAALIVAAGRGSRASGSGLPPKQYAPLAGRPVLTHAIAAFHAVPEIQRIAVVIHPDDAELYADCVRLAPDRLLAPVIGGATRQESVRLGLEALSADAPDLVLIHDAARPLVSPDTIQGVLDALRNHEGALAAQPVADTLKRAHGDGTVSDTLSRNGLWQAQTPQGFRFALIRAAHARAAADGRDDFTDDAALAEWAGLGVALVASPRRNFKITTQEDLAMAENLLRSNEPRLETRTGTGFDVHAFCEGDHVWVGGVRIAHDKGLSAHSDGDAPLHALTDALLGAIGEGDIGQHFPPSDPRWKGAASHIFLADAAQRVATRGGRIVNVDLTILCETPRIGPHRDAIRGRVAEILGLDVARVSVKATTTERLGFTGRGEGLAAMAAATVLMPA